MKKLLLLISLFGSLGHVILAQDVVKQANHFIQLLTEEQKISTLFPFDNNERYNFHFVPIKRKGVTFNEMSAEQIEAGLGLLKACLSEQTFKKTNDIVKLEVVLKELEKRKPEDKYRDPGNYHFTIFGIPSEKNIWGWRFEGHHISFNFSFDQKLLVSGTPGFLGSNPAIVPSGPSKGTQILKEESDLGFDLLHSLDPSQLKQAIIDSVAYGDILTFDKRSALIGAPKGIKYSDLTKEQKAKMLALVKLYVFRYTHLSAESMLKDIQKAGLDNLWFAWAGHTQHIIGKGAYYRVQGPSLLIEYDNTQNNANHVHSVIRDLTYDFGGDLLLEHYKKAH